MASSDASFWQHAVGATAVRVLLAAAGLDSYLASRIEVGTPVTAAIRYREGTQLIRLGMSPYAGSAFHGPPLLLAGGRLADSLFGFLLPGASVFAAPWRTLVTAAIDVAAAAALARLAAAAAHVSGRTDSGTSLGALYLWSPLTVACALGGSPAGLENAAVFGSLAAAAEGNAPFAAFCLAAAAYMGLHPLLLLVAVGMLLWRGPEPLHLLPPLGRSAAAQQQQLVQPEAKQPGSRLASSGHAGDSPSAALQTPLQQSIQRQAAAASSAADADSPLTVSGLPAAGTSPTSSADTFDRTTKGANVREVGSSLASPEQEFSFPTEPAAAPVSGGCSPAWAASGFGSPLEAAAEGADACRKSGQITAGRDSDEQKSVLAASEGLTASKSLSKAELAARAAAKVEFRKRFKDRRRREGGVAAAKFLVCFLLWVAALAFLSDMSLRHFPEHRCSSFFRWAPGGGAGCGAAAAELVPARPRHWAAETYGFMLKVPDLTPNIGLQWYFFSEMFAAFRPFWHFVFNAAAAAMTVPIVLRLAHRPLLVALVQMVANAMLKPYPSIGDTAQYLALLPLFAVQLACGGFPTGFLAGSFALLVGLGPAMWHMWIHLGSANANFFYAITLLFGAWQAVLSVSLVSATTQFDRLLAGKPGWIKRPAAAAAA